MVVTMICGIRGQGFSDVCVYKLNCDVYIYIYH